MKSNYVAEGALTKDYIISLFFYKDGKLVRRKNKGSAMKGNIVGCPNTQGHLQVRIDGIRYYVHQIVWLYHYGYIPKLIDHINRVPSDNRVENLREANKSINALNSKIPTSNTSGYKGVFFCNTKKRWSAFIEINGKRTTRSFKCKQRAVRERKIMEKTYACI